jgi:hypothetical protein
VQVSTNFLGPGSISLEYYELRPVFRRDSDQGFVSRAMMCRKEVGYSVEFFDLTVKTVVVVTVGESAMRVPTFGDRPSARTIVTV